jgi:hypothetical protein
VDTFPGFCVCFRTTTEVAPRPLDPVPDDDEDEPSAAHLSLAGQLTSQREPVAEFGESRHAEVITTAGDTVADVQLLGPGEDLWSGPEVGWWRRRRYRDIPPRRRLLQVTSEGAWATLDGVAGTLVRNGKRERLDVAGDVALIRPGDVLQLFEGERTFHVRFVTPPSPAPPKAAPLRRLLRSVSWPAWGGALAVHVVGLLIAGMLLKPWPVHTPFDVDREPEPSVAFLPTFTVLSSCAAGPDARRGEVLPILCCLADHSELTDGEVHLTWTVERNGRVRKARVHPTVSAAASGCIAEVVGEWHFPPRHAPLRTHYQLGLLGY